MRFVISIVSALFSISTFSLAAPYSQINGATVGSINSVLDGISGSLSGIVGATLRRDLLDANADDGVNNNLQVFEWDAQIIDPLLKATEVEV